MAKRLHTLLLLPMNATTLALFRICWGSVLFWEISRYWPRINDLYIQPDFHFTYDFFHWVQPWPGNGMYVHFFLMGMATLGVLVGFYYRFFSILLFVGFTSFFLMEQAKYLNHFYLVCLIAFTMIFVNADAALSLENFFRSPEKRSPFIPYWNLLLIRIQIVIVYLYGGIAKLNVDWLRCEPIRHWSLKSANHPIIGPIVRQAWSPYFYAYGGLLFDLAIGFLLLAPRTRRIAIPVVLFFHLSNAYMFNIGIFPWFMIAATVIFLDPNAMARRLRSFLGSGPAKNVPATLSKSRFALFFFWAYLGFQCLFPLRHWVIPGDVAWTEEGHKFSWRMKLRDKNARLLALVIDSKTGSHQLVRPQGHLTGRQARKMSTRPDMAFQYARYLHESYRKLGWNDPKVHLFNLVSLNGRPYRWMIDPRVDLSKADYSPFVSSKWIVPLEKSLPIGNYDLPKPSEHLLRQLGEQALADPSAPLPLPD